MREDLVRAAYRYGREQLGLTAAQAMRRARLRYELSCPCAGHREHVDDGPDPRDAWRQDARTELKEAP